MEWFTINNLLALASITGAILGIIKFAQVVVIMPWQKRKSKLEEERNAETVYLILQHVDPLNETLKELNDTLRDAKKARKDTNKIIDTLVTDSGRYERRLNNHLVRITKVETKLDINNQKEEE